MCAHRQTRPSPCVAPCAQICPSLHMTTHPQTDTPQPACGSTHTGQHTPPRAYWLLGEGLPPAPEPMGTWRSLVGEGTMGTERGPAHFLFGSWVLEMLKWEGRGSMSPPKTSVPVCSEVQRGTRHGHPSAAVPLPLPALSFSQALPGITFQAQGCVSGPLPLPASQEPTPPGLCPC